MTFHTITLFPEMFDSYLSESILARAKKAGKIDFKFYNPRDYAEAKNKKSKRPYLAIDDKPYGGGPGMVMKPEPVIKAVEVALKKIKSKKIKIVFFSPTGKQFDTSYAKTAAKKFTDIIFISGRYEGIDARVKKIFKSEEVSVGPYVLTGGELPAMIMIDSISRQISGVLGDFASLEESRAASPDVYTRPAILMHKGKKYPVPKILLTGHHAKIDEWKTKKRGA
jgi:tRNA (guanine37-N1)-methyltransferase